MTIMQNPQACINPPIRMDASIINNKAPSVEVKIPPAAVIAPSTNKTLAELCSFKKVMAANRGEIAVRICRGATEFNLKTATIYDKTPHALLRIQQLTKIATVLIVGILMSPSCYLPVVLR
mmetsp:Transcript_7436/g.16498  ORF Transcript_7436/g.16498 Transcript_7436/m.16498 type:complete len:121 (+) Transcript_7436:1283-1645(+)